METATPGVKSTGDGWLNRYLSAQQRDQARQASDVAELLRHRRAVEVRAEADAVYADLLAAQEAHQRGSR